MPALQYQRGPDDAPDDADVWQHREFRAAGTCLYLALPLSSVGYVFTLMDTSSANGSFDALFILFGWVALIAGAVAASAAAAFAWSANRYSLGLFPMSQFVWAIVPLLMAGLIFAVSCLY